jgi:hypothetical protein
VVKKTARQEATAGVERIVGILEGGKATRNAGESGHFPA